MKSVEFGKPIVVAVSLFALALGSGCGGKAPAPAVPVVQWRDQAGQTWSAPLKTPPLEDPVWTEHPGAGVVMRCAKTGKEELVADPDSWKLYFGRPNSPFRSKAKAPLVLPSAYRGKS